MPAAFFVFALDSGDVQVEPDLPRAAASIEPPDIGIAEVFDDTGRQYAITTDGRATTLVQTEAVNRDALEQRLRSYNQVANLQIDHSKDFVLAFADADSRWKWEHRWPRWPRWLDRWLHGTERRRYT